MKVMEEMKVALTNGCNAACFSTKPTLCTTYLATTQTHQNHKNPNTVAYMGTFIGHLGPGVAFTLLGLWHTINTITSYKLTAPLGNFTSKPWFRSAALKHLELYLVLSFSLVAIAIQVLDQSLDALEHATMFLHVAIYAFVALATDLTSSPIFGFIDTLIASVFAQELFILHFHSTSHTGLEGNYHWLLQLIVVVSLFASIAVVCFPANFPAAMVRSTSVMLQGLWFVNMGFVLWVPKMVPHGCFATSGGEQGAVACWNEDASRRAMVMANLQFSWMVAVVSVLVSIMWLWPDRKCMDYRKLRWPDVGDGQVSGGGA